MISQIKQALPNILSVLRIIGGLAAIYYFHNQSPGVLMLLLCFIAWTDFLDGKLARQWGCVSRLGSILDPIGDKIVTAVYLIGLYTVWGVGKTIMIFAITRDVFITITFILLYIQKKTKQAKPTFMGKLNTLVLGLYLLSCLTNIYIGESGYAFVAQLWEESFFWLLLGTLIWSSLEYLREGVKAYKS